MSNTQRHTCPAVRTAMFPHDMNGSGRIFGGVILSHIDIAGWATCRKVCSHRFVTVFFKSVEFKKPVFVNDILTCWAEVTKIGRTSVSTHIWVEVERDGQFIPVTEGEAIYVAVDDDDKPLVVETALTEYGKSLLRKQRRAEAKAKAQAARAGQPSDDGQKGSDGATTGDAQATGSASGVHPERDTDGSGAATVKTSGSSRKAKRRRQKGSCDC